MHGVYDAIYGFTSPRSSSVIMSFPDIRKEGHIHGNASVARHCLLLRAVATLLRWCSGLCRENKGILPTCRADRKQYEKGTITLK